MNGIARMDSLVATRELEFIRSSGEIELTVVSIFAPVKPEADSPCWCTFQIRSANFERVFTIAGEDSMQAMILSLRTIGSALSALAQEHNGTFTHFGTTELGFPDAST